ncbi:MAG: VanZ family protein [Bacteroidota bacterium]
MKQFIKYNLWGILWGVIIIVLTVLPGKVFPMLPSYMDLLQPDKLIHIFIFGVYVFLQIKGLRQQPVYPWFRKSAVFITMLIGLSLGAVTELLQLFFIPMRTGSIYDFIADAVGCLIGWGVFSYWQKRYGMKIS